MVKFFAPHPHYPLLLSYPDNIPRFITNHTLATTLNSLSSSLPITPGGPNSNLGWTDHLAAFASLVIAEHWWQKTTQLTGSIGFTLNSDLPPPPAASRHSIMPSHPIWCPSEFTSCCPRWGVLRISNHPHPFLLYFKLLALPQTSLRKQKPPELKTLYSISSS